MCILIELAMLLLNSVGLHKEEELKAMKHRLESVGLRTLDLTDNDMAKDHLRHLVGLQISSLNLILFCTSFV